MTGEVTLCFGRSFGDSSVIRGVRASLVTLVSLFERNDRISFDFVFFLLVRLVGGLIGADLFGSLFLLDDIVMLTVFLGVARMDTLGLMQLWSLDMSCVRIWNVSVVRELGRCPTLRPSSAKHSCEPRDLGFELRGD